MFFSGIILAICAGTLFGLNFTPVIYVQQHYEGASKNGMSDLERLLTKRYFFY